jgi:hypothetical protein
VRSTFIGLGLSVWVRAIVVDSFADRQACARPGEGRRDRQPDAGSATADEDSFAVEPASHDSLRLMFQIYDMRAFVRHTIRAHPRIRLSARR